MEKVHRASPDGVIPAARVEKLGPAPVTLRGPALLTVVGGEVRVRSCDSADTACLVEHDVLGVPAGHCAEVEACADLAELMLLEVDAPWAERARALAGVEAVPVGLQLIVERAGTLAARRGERLLTALGRPAADLGDRARLRSVSCLVEALAILSEPRRPEPEPGAPRNAGRRALFREAAAQLATGSLEDVSLERFARGVGLSARQVSRLFRDEFGMSFRDYVVELRIERAKDLLARTRHSITDVAGETGWSSLGHFNSVFRRRVGATPTEYRAQCGVERASWPGNPLSDGRGSDGEGPVG